MVLCKGGPEIASSGFYENRPSSDFYKNLPRNDVSVFLAIQLESDRSYYIENSSSVLFL